MSCPSWVHTNPSWPNIVDSTNGRDGTRWNRALGLAMQQYVDELTGVYYGLPSPANIAEEIAAARGNRDCLDERLDVAMDEDGNLKIPPTVATKEDIAGLAGENLIGNDLFVCNPQGDAAAPLFWTSDIAGTWSISYANGFGKVTFTAGGAATFVYTDIVPASMIPRAKLLLKHADGIGFGMSVETNATGVRCAVTDGVEISYSDVHGAGGSEEWLETDGVVAVSPSSLYVRAGVQVPAGATVSFYAPMANIGPKPPKSWKPARTRQLVQTYALVGNDTSAYVGDGRFQFAGPGDGFIESLWMGASTAMPTGKNATWTLKRYNGSTWDVVDTIALLEGQQYQYKDLAVAEELRVVTQPRGTIASRCMLFAWGLAVTGASPHAQDIFVAARIRAWERPLYSFFDPTL